MDLPEHLYTETPLSGQQGAAQVVVVAIGGGAVMVLVLAACVCWGRNSNGLVRSRGDSRRDTVPLDDLLSKPSLADPESVFSEAGSNDFRPIPRAGSRFVASGDENSFWHESGSVSGASHGDRDTSYSHLLVGLNNEPDPNTGLPARKGNYQGKQLMKTNKSAQQLELEQLQQQNRQNVDNEATSRSDCSRRLKTTADPVHLGGRFVHDVSASVHTTGGSPKTGSHKDISEKIGLDPASLKIHRDSVPADSAPFLSPARCSFSHEVGHIVHGNHTPRPSLPRTEEVESDQADSCPDPKNVHDSSRKATRLSVEVKATELSVNVHSGQFEELPPANLTFTSQGQVRGQDLQVNETTDSNHRVSLSYQCVSSQDTQQPGGEIIGSTTADRKDNPDISCEISHSKSYVTNQINTGRPASDLDQCQRAGVTMRRCLSCVQDDAVCPEPATKPRRQTFSLNLKIDVHFDNERESCENLATVVCSPLMEYIKPGNHAAAESCQRFATSVSINNKNNNNINSINHSHSQGGCHVDTDAKERQLEKSFADKSLHRNSHTFASAGKQCSGLRTAELSQVKTCNTGQPNQRLSGAGSLTDTAAGAAVVGAGEAARSEVTALQAASRNLAATDGESASEIITAASGGVCAGKGVSSSPADVMTADADVSRAGRIATDDQAVREITVTPTTVEGTATADSNSGIFPTQCQPPKAVSPGAESNTEIDRADVSPGADDDVVGKTSVHNREDSCHHPAKVNRAQTTMSISGANHHHPEDAVRAEAVVSSQRVDGSGHSQAEHCKPKSIVATTLSNSECEDSTNTKTHSDSNLSEETTDTNTHSYSNVSGESVDTKTRSNSNISGESRETKTQSDSNISGESRETKTQSDSNVSGESTETKTQSDSNVSGESREIKTQSDSNVSGESTETKTHSDDRLVEETNDANRAGSVHQPDEGSVKQTAVVDGATKRPEIHRRALTVKEGHVRTTAQTNQTGDAKFQRSASVKTTSVHERPRPSLGSSDNRQDRRQAVFFHDMKDLTTEPPGCASQEETHGKQSEFAAPDVTARTQGRPTGSKEDTNTLNNQDHVTPGFNQGGPETIMKGHTQMMKQRLAGSALRGHATAPPHKQEQGVAVELVSVSPRDKGTVSRISTKAPKPAPRRWTAGTDKRDSPAHEPDLSATSVIAINIEDCTGSTETADVSDDSDYDNPWDSLDDAVKRASIRYNRRPSRIAAGDTKTLLLKSAEDLGRLLEEADKRRHFRQTRNSCQVVSPETDSFTIPFTRFSPYRHTVKDTVSQSQMATAHSTETLLKTEMPNYPQLSLLRPGDAVAADHRVLDAQRPMSLTSKVRAKITSPETKPRKK